MIVGIDPGSKSGAIGVIADQWAGAIDLPAIGTELLNIPELWDWIRMHEWPVSKVFIEKAQPMPRQGVVSVFKYGRAYGQLIAWLQMTGYPFQEVPPSQWKAKMGLSKKDKEESIRLASQCFPGVDLKRKKDHGRAEALLLAEYGRRYCL